MAKLSGGGVMLRYRGAEGTEFGEGEIETINL
jgi:hypothetical protein